MEYAFSSPEAQEASDKDEIALLNVNVDEQKVDRDLYKKILVKLFACMRYQMYKMIKQFWDANRETLLPEFERR